MHKVCRTMAAMLLLFIYDMSPAEAKCPCSVGELLEAEAEVGGAREGGSTAADLSFSSSSQASPAISLFLDPGEERETREIEKGRSREKVRPI